MEQSESDFPKVRIHFGATLGGNSIDRIILINLFFAIFAVLSFFREEIGAYLGKLCELDTPLSNSNGENRGKIQKMG